MAEKENTANEGRNEELDKKCLPETDKKSCFTLKAYTCSRAGKLDGM